MSDGQPHLVPSPQHRCRFVKTSGARCTTPALHHRELCFAHERRLNLVRGKLRPTPPATFNTVPLVNFVWAEDHHSILFNLNQIALALASGAIDAHQAGAMTSLMRTCLRTLRQMRAIESVEEPVAAYIDENGQPMALPTEAGLDPAPVDQATPQPDHPTAAPASASASAPAPAPVPVPVPALSYDANTKEGQHNIHQEMLWTYFAGDPPAGVSTGLDLHWPGRPAADPLPVASAPIADAPAADLPAADAPIADAPIADPPAADSRPGLTLLAVAQPRPLTPAKSTPNNRVQPLTPAESTHTPCAPANPFRIHTYAKSQKKTSTPPNRPPHAIQARPTQRLTARPKKRADILNERGPERISVRGW
ncbi:MAG TPA: hypothetical protein VHX60_08095 [Acidobacteriaceae bacterium]|jgi:hypothetical protein|nr:hypothetical protein [Acidobacteriaceae bacterium]